MARHSGRLNRLCGGSNLTPEQLRAERLRRMTDEQIEARILELCKKTGIEVPADPARVSKWIVDELPYLVDAVFQT